MLPAWLFDLNRPSAFEAQETGSFGCQGMRGWPVSARGSRAVRPGPLAGLRCWARSLLSWCMCWWRCWGRIVGRRREG